MDVWLLGITVVFCGEYFGWNTGLSAGIYGMILSTVLMGGAYVCFCCCVAEVTGALPFAGGSNGLARCTLGFFPAFLIGSCEALEYIGVIATTMTAIAGMIVQIAPACEVYQPFIMLAMYVSVVGLQLLGTKTFWLGSVVLGTTSLGIWLVFFFSTVSHTDFQADAVRDGSELFVGGTSECLRVFPFSSWFYIGIEVLNLASNDFLHPKLTIPRGQASLAVAFVLMSLATLLVTVSLPHPGQQITDLAMNPAPLNSGFIISLGLSNNAATALGIPASYASIYGFVWSYTKLLHAMASSKLLPPILATKSAGGIPYVAMIVGTVVSYIVCVVVFYKPTWASYVLPAGLLFAFMSYTGQCIGYISLKFRYLDRHPSEFKSPFGVAGAIYAIFIWVLGFVCIVFFQGNNGKEVVVFSTSVAIVTVCYHLYSKKHQALSDQENKVLLVAHVMNSNNKRNKQRQERNLDSARASVLPHYLNWFVTLKHRVASTISQSTVAGSSEGASRTDAHDHVVEKEPSAGVAPRSSDCHTSRSKVYCVDHPPLASD